jgi:sugar transferase (PEP-CTERM/EpsH1 system associated)
MTSRSRDGRPLIAHIVFRFDYGGLENGVVNVVNGLPESAFRHAIIALTESTDFKSRLRSDISVHALHKQPGKDPAVYVRLFRILKTLRPAVTHSRNLATLEGSVVARLAGVPQRIHSEHGWDIYDPDGTNRKYRAMRRFANPMISRFVTVSRELEEWLATRVGIPSSKITRICNGVDTDKFRPVDRSQASTVLPGSIFPPDSVVVTSVTRFSPIKDPLNLVRAFISARRDPAGASLRLAMIGDGPLREDALRELREAKLESDAWLPGARDDVAPILRGAAIYALGSLREGISNTVLESMATGLPVIATRTGGNVELVEDGVTGRLVAPGHSGELAEALLAYMREPRMRTIHGAAARMRAENEYSLRRMLAGYEALYRAHSVEYGEAA